MKCFSITNRRTLRDNYSSTSNLYTSTVILLMYYFYTSGSLCYYLVSTVDCTVIMYSGP